MKSKSTARRWWLVGTVLVVFVYALAGFFFMPWLIRRQVTARGSAALDRPVTLERVRFNPFTFTTTLGKLTVAAKEGGTLASWDGAQGNFDPWESLLRRQWRLGEVTLIGPHARLIIDRDGRLNIADLLSSETNRPQSQSGGLPACGVDRLTVAGGSLEFTDRSLPTEFTSTVQPISFSLEDFSTKPNGEGTYRLAGKTARGESFAWTGRLSAVPLGSEGHIEFKAVALPAYAPFLTAHLHGVLAAGVLDLSTDYTARFGGTRTVKLSNLKFGISDLSLEVSEREAPAMRFPSIAVEVPEADLFKRTAHVHLIQFTDPTARVVREADGSIDLLRLIEPQPADAASKAMQAESVTPQPPLQLQLDQLAVDDGSVEFTDQALGGQSMERRITSINLVARDATAEMTKPVPLELSFRLQDGPGTVTATGTVTPQSLALTANVRGSDLDLSLVSPYVESLVAAKILSGTASFSGSLGISQPAEAPLSAHWSGDLAIDNFQAEDKTLEEPLVGWSHLAIGKSEATLNPRQINIGEVQLNGPALRVIRGKDGKLNLIKLVSGDTDAGEASKKSATAASRRAPSDSSSAADAPEISINTFRVESGTIHVIDRSMASAVKLEINNIQGEVSGLSTAQGKAGKLKLTATVLGSPPASFAGDANLLGPDAFTGSNLSLDLRQVALEPLEPYAVQFLGYRVREGRMKGDFQYQLVRGELNGSNHIVLDRFYLGEPAPSPDALSVPIKLALAVLRNRDGQVVIDVPVSGSVRSPNFDFGETIRSALANVLGKIATAPLKYLGSLFGGGAELSQAEFPAGNTDLAAEADHKLDVLERVLRERPSLKLLIHAQAPSENDQRALREQQLDQQLQQTRDRLGREGNDLPLDSHQVLTALYWERFQPQSHHAASTTAGETASGAPIANEHRAWYVRLWRFLFGKTRDTPAPATTTVAPPAATISEAEMRKQLLASISIDAAAGEKLARARAMAARQRLLDAGIEPRRITVAPGLQPAASAADGGQIAFELAETNPTRGPGAPSRE